MLILSPTEISRLSKRDRMGVMALARQGRVRLEDGGHWTPPNWTPQDKQREFLACDADEALYGGAAGGGKTDALAMYSIFRRLRYPGSKGLMVRRQMADITSAGALLDRLHELLDGVAHYNGYLKRFLFSDGGFIELGHCPDGWDRFRARYQGVQVDDLCVDEAGQWPERHLQWLPSRVRSTVPGCPTRIRLATNPGGPGHGYLKRRYVTPSLGREGETWTPEPTHDQPTPGTRCFIPARLDDNPALVGRDPAYRAKLQQLPELERLALLEGSWDVFSGMFFDEWDEGIHVVDPFPIPDHWRRITGLDWGYTHPTVVLWGAIDPEGVVYLYREVALRKKQVAGEDGLASRIQEYADTSPTIAAGGDVFTRQREYLGGPSIAEAFEREGVILTDVTKGRKRIHTWAQARHYLTWRDDAGHKREGRPLLRIFRGACPKLCQQLSEMIYDPDDAEDLLKVDCDPETGEGGDDAVDALGHLLMARPYRTVETAEDTLPAWSMERLGKEKEKRRKLVASRWR